MSNVEARQSPALARLREAQLVLAYRRRQRVLYPHAPFMDDKVRAAQTRVVIALALLWFEQTGEVSEPYSSLKDRKLWMWAQVRR